MKTTNVIGTTAAEAEVLAATAAALEAGGDPFGDNDDDDATASTAADTDDTDTDDTGNSATDAQLTDGAADGDDTGAAADGELDADALAAVAAEDAAAEPAQAPRYKAADPADMAAQRVELITQKAKALKDLMDGVIEPEEYSRIEGEVSDKLDALTVQRTLHEANVQGEASAWDTALENVMTSAKEAGTIDYTADAAAAKQFDMATAMLKVDGKQRTLAQLATDAHKAVLAMRGIAGKAPKAEPAAPRTNGKPPLTLRNVPAAAMPNSGGNWQDALNKLTGQEYEAAYARLTQAQRDTLLND